MVNKPMLSSIQFILGFLSAAYAQSCGHSPFSPYQNVAASYTVGGVYAFFGEFPWQVGLIENRRLICGGTYILGTSGSVKVVTAAHCITSNPNNYTVVFGMHRTSTSTKRLTVPVFTITSHNQYNDRTMQNDIAIISFNNLKPSDLSDTFASPVCLASRAYYTNEMAVVSGWGTMTEGDLNSDALKYAWMPILDFNFCNTETGNAGYLDQTMMCAGYNGQYACQGNSGGPLVVYRDGHWELAGVASRDCGFGSVCYPGVYADAWYNRNWIESNA